ncbi:hypothetical protein VFC49_05035 [Thermococcus sp. SY098]|uniref:hypothetical protein n=1 Tax=Thermococcus sp. SY098 TaxID=3111325 RepID=UPI002D76C52C|nr:hypothetical protein [Thermococcus sp. SY098]WRS53469.1 hypothetical protein VFC49_05035 [Thermococcus sp. SY098]
MSAVKKSLLGIALLLLLTAPPVLSSKVLVWNTGGWILHPRFSPDGLYFSDYSGRLGLKTSETHFIFWRLPIMPNGMSVSDRVYISADWGPPAVFDPIRDAIYIWSYPGVSFVHVFAVPGRAYYAGKINESGGIGVLTGNDLVFYDLSSAGIVKVYDTYATPEGIYFTAELNESPYGGIGLLQPENKTFILWRFPSNYSRLIPDGIVLGHDGLLYAAIMEGDATGLIRFSPENGSFFFKEQGGRPLHVKAFGNRILLMASEGFLVLVDPSNVNWTFESVLEGREYRFETAFLGKPTKTENVTREEREIKPEYRDVVKEEFNGIILYNILGTHDFGGGYVGEGGALVLVDELRPKVHLIYENGTVRAWVTPEDIFTAPVFLYVNEKLVRWSKEIVWNATFLAGRYNLTAVYFDGEDVYMNTTTVVSDLRPRLVWSQSLKVEGGTVIYGMASHPGVPVNVSGRTVWTDGRGYFSFFVENATETETAPLEEEGEPNHWSIALLIFALPLGVAGAVLIGRKERKGYALLIIALVLAALYFTVPRAPREAGEEKPLTLSLLVVMPPGFYASNVTVIVDGENAGRTNSTGRLEVPIDYGLHEIRLLSGGAETRFEVAMAENRTLVVPFFPGVNATLTNGPGYAGFSASVGSVTLSSMHPGTYPLGPMKGGETGGELDSGRCDLCKLKAAMVGAVEGEACKLCCLQSKNFGPAVVFNYYFHLVWAAIERFDCITPWPPMPETNSVVGGAAINSYADDLENSLPKPGWGSIHPCLSPLDGLDPADPSTICSALECADIKFDCNCYVTCFLGPFKMWDAFMKCIGS